MTDVTTLPRISIKTELKKAQARPFVGRVVNDSMKESIYEVEKKPYQWSLAVEPIKSPDGTKGFQIGGKTGAFWEYIPVPREAIEDGDISDQTKFGRHFNAFQSVFGVEEDRAPGRGEFLNELAWWIKEEIQYGTNKQDGSIIKGTLLYPIRRLTDEEMQEYGLAPRGATVAPSVTFSQDDLLTVVSALDGTPRSSLQKQAFSKKLPTALRTAVGKGDGPAIQQAVASGLAEFDGDTFRAI